MKTFKFNLENVLNYKKFLEENALFKFSRALSEMQQAQEKLKNKEEALNYYCRGLNSGSLSLPSLLHLQEFLSVVNNEVKRQRNRVAEAEKKLSRKREEFIDARRKRQVFENLKERRLMEYGYDAYREEQKKMDEIGNNSFIYRGLDNKAGK